MPSAAPPDPSLSQPVFFPPQAPPIPSLPHPPPSPLYMQQQQPGMQVGMGMGGGMGGGMGPRPPGMQFSPRSAAPPGGQVLPGGGQMLMPPGNPMMAGQVPGMPFMPGQMPGGMQQMAPHQQMVPHPQQQQQIQAGGPQPFSPFMHGQMPGGGPPLGAGAAGGAGAGELQGGGGEEGGHSGGARDGDGPQIVDGSNEGAQGRGGGQLEGGEGGVGSLGAEGGAGGEPVGGGGGEQAYPPPAPPPGSMNLPAGQPGSQMHMQQMQGMFPPNQGMPLGMPQMFPGQQPFPPQPMMFGQPGQMMYMPMHPVSGLLYAWHPHLVVVVTRFVLLGFASPLSPLLLLRKAMMMQTFILLHSIHPSLSSPPLDLHIVLLLVQSPECLPLPFPPPAPTPHRPAGHACLPHATHEPFAAPARHDERYLALRAERCMLSGCVATCCLQVPGLLMG